MISFFLQVISNFIKKAKGAPVHRQYTRSTYKPKAQEQAQKQQNAPTTPTKPETPPKKDTHYNQNPEAPKDQAY
jgi:hypothetical protein